jgi:cyclic pyranopterin phosphate synthase
MFFWHNEVLIQGVCPMKDSYGREIDYLRISITDRCNLRCVYCMPMDELDFIPGEALLTPKEIERVARAAADAGFRKIRLTGGEPTLRQDVVEIVERLARIPGIRELVMTTNGLRLPWMAESLAQAGLQRVNIHLDSLHETRLARVMRLNSLDKVCAGIEAAERAELVPIKLNVVVTGGYNEEDVVDLAKLTLKRDWHVRFIELMPLGEPAEIAFNQYVSTRESMDRIQAALGPLFSLNEGEIVGEARLYRLANARGTVGFISPVSNPYCDSCSRMRLTADGRIRLCLLSEKELNFRETLRGGGSHQDLVALFQQAVSAKPMGHQLRQGIHPANRTMSQIGG